MTTDTLPPLVVLTTNDPERCAQALALLLPTIDAAGALAIVAYGPRGAECMAVAEQVRQAVAIPIAIGQVDAAGGGNQAQAVNAALQHGTHQAAPLVYVLDDDVRLCAGWMQGLAGCLHPDTVHGIGRRVLQGYDSVGLVVPCTDQTTSRAQRIALSEAEAHMGLEDYAAARLAHFAGKASAADVVDGCCVMLTRAVVEACMEGDALLDAGLGAWAWADLCLRATKAGHRALVSEAVYVGRTTAVPLGYQHPGDVADRLRFYAKHPPPAEQRLVAAVVAPLGSYHMLQLLRANLRRVASLCNGVAVLVGGNPLQVQHDPEYQAAVQARRVLGDDQRLLEACSGQDAAGVAAHVLQWVQGVLSSVPDRVVGRLSVQADVWDGPQDLRMQRNRTLRMAEQLGADAVLALDYDEVMGAGVQAAHLQHLLGHPNPLARAWDVGVVYHWDAPSLVREDAPWGHGGRYTGGPHGVRLLRLCGGRAGLVLPGAGAGALPDTGLASQRVANLHVRRFRAAREADRGRLRIRDSAEGMRVSAYSTDHRIGLHMLTYEGEDPEDVARWLDHVHGLVDRVVLVWTGAWEPADRAWIGKPEAMQADAWPATGPGRALAAVGHLHGCHWVHQPLDDHFANARNAGIDALRAHGGMRWAWFVDPDEWLGDHLGDGVALRNMAASDRWGWLMQVVNYRADRDVPTISDSVRISRLDPDGVMRMDGRVHEGFNHAIHRLQADDVHPRLVYAPFMLQQRGMALGPAQMHSKLVKYERMLRKELAENPHNPGAWVSLGWHYFNDGHTDQGVECYHRAVACAGSSYLPFRELAYHHLRIARGLMEACDDRLVDSHQFAALARQMKEWLQRYAPPHPVIPRLETSGPEPLPDWQPPDAPGASGYDAP